MWAGITRFGDIEVPRTGFGEQRYDNGELGFVLRAVPECVERSQSVEIRSPGDTMSGCVVSENWSGVC